MVAGIAIRAASLFVHGIVKALLDREATEGTAQELSAVELKKRMDTLERLCANVIQFFIVVIAALMILDKLGLSTSARPLAGLGVIGIAVGFGAQTLVRDYLTGALILVENQFSVGDVVRLAGVEGTVEDFNLRRTTVRDIDGVVHTIPNGEIKVASNLTRVWARINQDVTVAYGTDIDRAIQVVDDVGQAMKADPAWRKQHPRAASRRAGRSDQRTGRDPEDPRLGPRLGPVGGGRRVPQAPDRRAGRQWDRHTGARSSPLTRSRPCPARRGRMAGPVRVREECP